MKRRYFTLAWMLSTFVTSGMSTTGFSCRLREDLYDADRAGLAALGLVEA
jgi:hypothetical protein